MGRLTSFRGPSNQLSLLKGKYKGRTTRDKRSQIRNFFLQILAEFCFSWELQHFGGADFRRKPQETAEFRRKPQETAEFSRNPFVPLSLSLLIPPVSLVYSKTQLQETIPLKNFQPFSASTVT